MSRRPAILIVNLLLCYLLRSEAAAFSVGSRAILRSLGDTEKKVEVDHAVELNATNFDAVLRDTPATYAVVEFFANWLVFFLFFNNFILKLVSAVNCTVYKLFFYDNMALL